MSSLAVVHETPPSRSSGRGTRGLVRSVDGLARPPAEVSRRALRIVS